MARFPGFSDEQVDEIQQQALQFWDASTRAMEPFFKNVNDLERISRVLLPAELEEQFAAHTDRSALVPPDIKNNLDSIRSEICANVFSSKPFMHLSTQGQPAMRTPIIRKGEWVLQSMLDHGFKQDFDKALHQLLYAGVTCVFTKWEVEKAKIPRRDKETHEIQRDKNNRWITEEKEVAAYGRMLPIDIRRTRIDPSITDWENRRMVGFHRCDKLQDLKDQNKGQFYNFDPEELERTNFGVEDYYKHVPGERVQYGEIGSDGKVVHADHNVEIYAIRGQFRVSTGVDSYKYHDLVVEIGNKTLLIGLKPNDLPNPSWEQFDFPILDNEHGRLFPMGIAEPAMDTFIEKFLKLNQALDITNRNTYVRYVIDTSAAMDLPDTLEHIPDQLVKIDLNATGATSLDAIFKPLAMGQSSQETFMHARSLEDVIQQTMKRNDYSQGMDPSRKETATAVDALVSGGKLNLSRLLSNIQGTMVEPVCRKMLIYYNLFKGHEENQLSTPDGQVVDIAPGELDFLFNVDIELATDLNHPTMVRRMIELYPAISNDPYFEPFEVRLAMVQMLKLPNADKLLPARDYMELQVDRENIALGAGLDSPVHPMDNHTLHIKVHMRYYQFAQQKGLDVQMIMRHIQQHEQMLEQQTKGIGNTKEMGGNTGNVVSSQGNAMTRSPFMSQNKSMVG